LKHLRRRLQLNRAKRSCLEQSLNGNPHSV